MTCKDRRGGNIPRGQTLSDKCHPELLPQNTWRKTRKKWTLHANEPEELYILLAPTGAFYPTAPQQSVWPLQSDLCDYSINAIEKNSHKSRNKQMTYLNIWSWITHEKVCELGFQQTAKQCKKQKRTATKSKQTQHTNKYTCVTHNSTQLLYVATSPNIKKRCRNTGFFLCSLTTTTFQGQLFTTRKCCQINHRTWATFWLENSLRSHHLTIGRSLYPRKMCTWRFAMIARETIDRV